MQPAQKAKMVPMMAHTKAVGELLAPDMPSVLGSGLVVDASPGLVSCSTADTGSTVSAQLEKSSLLSSAPLVSLLVPTQCSARYIHCTSLCSACCCLSQDVA